MFGLSIPEIADLLAWALLVVGFLLFLWLILAIFLFSAKKAGIENRTYGKAFQVLMIHFLLGFLIPANFSLFPEIGSFVGFVASFLVGAAVTAWIFSASFGDGVITEVLFMIYCFCLWLVIVSLFAVFAFV